MRAATIREQEIVIEEHPDPIPGTGEVLVRVRAAALNGGDIMQRRGLYPAPPGSPQDIPGMEFAGEVAAPGPGRRSLRRGRAGDGDRRRRRAGGARRRPRARTDAGPGGRWTGPRLVGCRRSSPPRTTRSSPRHSCAPASGCSYTAAPVVSAPPRSSSHGPPAQASPPACATRRCTSRSARSARA